MVLGGIYVFRDVSSAECANKWWYLRPTISYLEVVMIVKMTIINIQIKHQKCQAQKIAFWLWDCAGKVCMVWVIVWVWWGSEKSIMVCDIAPILCNTFAIINRLITAITAIRLSVAYPWPWNTVRLVNTTTEARLVANWRGWNLDIVQFRIHQTSNNFFCRNIWRLAWCPICS